jgi:DNA-binding protein
MMMGPDCDFEIFSEFETHVTLGEGISKTVDVLLILKNTTKPDVTIPEQEIEWK